MKRHFSFGFKALAACAMSAMLAVSCYDDSALRTELEGVKGDLTELADRLSKLETSLNDQVAALNTAIGAVDAKVAVVKVEEKDGNYVLTFSNGKTLVVSAADANANNTGLVTTITEDDVTYWAVVGEDGVPVKLNAVVHPDTQLSFKVNPETGLLEVSYDGKTYESTGVFVNDDTTFNVVEKFVDAEDYVILTVGGQEYQLPKVSTNYFEIVSGMQYFSYDEYDRPETKNIPVEMDGVISYMVANAPEGWTVVLKGNSLVVTAPEYDNFDADNSGVIEVWVVTEDGQTKVGTVKVSVGSTPAAFTFSNNFEDVAVQFASSSELYYFGVVKSSEFDKDAIAELVLASEKKLVDGVFWNDDNDGGYLYKAEYKFEELLGSKPVAGETYTFWSVTPTFTADYSDIENVVVTMSVSASDIAYENVSVYTVTAAEPANITFKGADLDVAVAGLDKFFLGYVEMSYSNPFYGYMNPDDIAGSIGQLAGMVGMSVWDFIMDGFAMGPGGNSYVAQGDVFESEFKGNLSEVLTTTPGTSYVGILIPLIEGKATDAYTASDIVTLDAIQLTSLGYDGTATVTFGEPTNVTTSSFDLTVNTDGALLYYCVAPAGTFPVDYEDIIVDLVDGGDYAYYFTAFEGKSLDLNVEYYMNDPYYTLKPNTEYEVYAFAIDAEGNCSNLVSKPVKTADFTYSEDLVISNIEASAANEAATAVFTVGGQPKTLYYFVQLTSLIPDATTEPDEYAAYLERVLMAPFNEDEYTIFPVAVDVTSENYADGKITIDDIYIGNARDRVIFGFVQDVNGALSARVTVSNVFHDATQE